MSADNCQSNMSLLGQTRVVGFFSKLVRVSVLQQRIIDMRTVGRQVHKLMQFLKMSVFCGSDMFVLGGTISDH